MKKNTALDWANMIDVTVEEFNENLAELGYQSKDSENQRWLRTPKGVEHSEQFCGRADGVVPGSGTKRQHPAGECVTG